MKLSATAKKIAFLGVGNMGSALIQGALRSGKVRSERIRAFDLDSKRLRRVCRMHHIVAADSNLQAAAGADFIFLCVKPQQMQSLLGEIREQLHAGQCLISIAAGVSTRSIERSCAAPVPVIRVMPNTPALVGCGMAALAGGKFASKPQLRFAQDFFSSVGKVVTLPEKLFDAVTAVSGSGPAYLFYLAESLEKAAENLGLEKSVAQILARQTLWGSVQMLSNSHSPRELRQQVTSPGGTTESAIRYLEGKSWSEIFQQAVAKAKFKSTELSASR